MHFTSMKIILLALFPAAHAQGQGPSKASDVPPGYIRAPVRHLWDPKIVHIKPSLPPLPGSAVVKTTEYTWMPLKRNGEYYRRHGGGVFEPSPHDSSIRVSNANADRFKPGHTAVMAPDEIWEHYKAGKVPENVMPQASIEEANKVAYQHRRKKTQLPTPSNLKPARQNSWNGSG